MAFTSAFISSCNVTRKKYCFMPLSTARVQCGPQDDSIAMKPCISSLSAFSSFIISRIPWPSWWWEALIARPPASLPAQPTIRMEVILPVMTLITTVLPSALTFRHACHVRFKARQCPKQESRVIWDGHSVSTFLPSYGLRTSPWRTDLPAKY